MKNILNKIKREIFYLLFRKEIEKFRGRCFDRAEWYKKVKNVDAIVACDGLRYCFQDLFLP